MPINITSTNQLKPGDLFENCNYHPCLCITVDGDDVTAISLIDGSYPCGCSISHCGLRKLSIEETLIWKLNGPQYLNIEQRKQVDSIKNKWWKNRWWKT